MGTQPILIKDEVPAIVREIMREFSTASNLANQTADRGMLGEIAADRNEQMQIAKEQRMPALQGKIIEETGKAELENAKRSRDAGFIAGAGGNARTSPTRRYGVISQTNATPLEIDDNTRKVLAEGITKLAEAKGLDPLDLATIFSYETGGTFNPDQAGPTTKWGQHFGLGQMGGPQREQHGYTPGVSSIPEQLDAIGKYLDAVGVKPKMSRLDVYSAINAGRPGLYNRSDRPGWTVQKHVEAMGPHEVKARQLLGMGGPSGAPEAEIVYLPTATIERLRQNQPEYFSKFVPEMNMPPDKSGKQPYRFYPNGAPQQQAVTANAPAAQVDQKAQAPEKTEVKTEDGVVEKPKQPKYDSTTGEEIAE